MKRDDLNTTAPSGQIYVCAACGKQSTTRSGYDENLKRLASSGGWDESCMLHAVLCYDEEPLRAVPESLTEEPPNE